MILLVTGAANFSKTQLQYIESLGHNVFFIQNEKESLPVEYAKIEAVICNGLFLYHDIKQFKNLRYIQLTSAGYDRVPMDYIREKHIQIYNARGVYSIPMAEFAVAAVLQIYKESRYFYKNQEEHLWNKNRGLRELFGKRVCIVGCGSVGTECAKRFEAFGCKVTGVDIFPRQKEHYAKLVAINDVSEAISEADVIVLTVPLTKETAHLFDRKLLEQIKDEAILINIARGGIIDTEALIEVLDKKEIVAVLDVFEEEPLPENNLLWNMKNVILTPHNSFVSNKNTDRLYKLTVDNLKSWS